MTSLFSLKGGVIRLVMFERGFGRVFGPLGVKGVASRPALTSRTIPRSDFTVDRR